jgi:anthranilate phosphoribosyltransferase
MRRENLTPQEAGDAMKMLMSKEADPVKKAAFLVALQMKGPTREEIAALAGAMRSHAKIIHPLREPLVDTCGTGGDSSNTFNISTAAAFIAAGAGVTIAKHGNRSVSSACGSADVLETLGVGMLQPEAVERCIDQIGIGFMFAPYFHPAMKNVAEVRKLLETRTIFNILGPLANPAGASAQVLGVFDPNLREVMANVLLDLGTERALVVHSNGMDEIGLGCTIISELRDGMVTTREIDAVGFGIAGGAVPKVASKEESASVIWSVLNGDRGPARDISMLNAAAAIYVAGAADSITDGLRLARDSIDSGAAMAKLEALREFTQRFSHD